MSTKQSKDSLVLELFKDKAITYSTIDSLLKYGFDTNESLLSLEYDLDFPQMPDICQSQKCLLRKRLTDFRKTYNRSKDWLSDHCLDMIKTEESSDSCQSVIDNQMKFSPIFAESSAIVHHMRDQVVRQHNESKSLPKNLVSIEFTFEPIVDHLRESLIKVEKQKHERDLIIERQKTDLKVKELEILKLEAEKKQLESQLICEKLKAEKLDYKLKSSVNHRNNQFLDDLNAVYYHKNPNIKRELDSPTDDQSPTRSISSEGSQDLISEFKSNFVNFWTEVESNPAKGKSNRNLEQLNASLFTEYVAKHSKSSESNDKEFDSNMNTAEEEDSLNFLLTDPTDQNNDKSHKWSPSSERPIYEDISDNSNNGCEPEVHRVVTSSPHIESIVCEPDFDFNSNDLIEFSYKTKSHLQIENNRVVINTLANKSNNSRQRSPNGINSKKAQSLLKSHKQSLLKAFRCHYQNCNLSFVSAEGLKRHVRSVHTKERPFKCNFDDCQKRFGRSDALKEHLKRHMGLKLYECSYTDCDFKSVSSNSLKRHVFSIHLKEKHFKCLYENCKKTFGRKDSLKKHMEKQHSICELSQDL